MECPRCLELNLRTEAKVCDQCGRRLPEYDKHSNVLCWNVFKRLENNLYYPVYHRPKLTLRALIESEKLSSTPTDYAFPNVKYLVAYKTDDIGKGHSSGTLYTSVLIPLFPQHQATAYYDDELPPFSIGEDRVDNNRLLKLAGEGWTERLEPWEYVLLIDENDNMHYMHDARGLPGRFESEEELIDTLNSRKQMDHMDNLVIAQVHSVDLLTQSTVLCSSIRRLVNAGKHNYQLGLEIPDHSQYIWLSGRLIG